MSDWVPALLKDPHRDGICIPVGVTFGDMDKIVVKYGDNHPEQLHVDRGSGVLLSLKDVFSCKSEGK